MHRSVLGMMNTSEVRGAILDGRQVHNERICHKYEMKLTLILVYSSKDIGVGFARPKPAAASTSGITATTTTARVISPLYRRPSSPRALFEKLRFGTAILKPDLCLAFIHA